MILGLTRGELLLVAFIFGLIYAAGLLPKIAARLSSSAAGPEAGTLANGNDEGAQAKPKGE